MQHIKLIFWFPLLILNGIKLLIPFNSGSYRPSTEEERELSENMRNTARLTAYKIRKLRY